MSEIEEHPPMDSEIKAISDILAILADFDLDTRNRIVRYARDWANDPATKRVETTESF